MTTTADVNAEPRYRSARVGKVDVFYREAWNCPGLMDKWFRQLSELRTRLDCGTRGLSEVV